MIKVHESKIGIYYAQAKETDQLVQLDSFLLTKTDSISTLFEHKLSGKVQFEFYPRQTLAEFVCGWDTTDSEQAFKHLGCAHYINKIQLVVPGASSRSDKDYANWGGSHKVCLHEYIHSFTYSIVGENRINEIPFLFAEGIAVYVSEQLYFNSRFKEIIYKRIEEKEVPKFQRLIVNHKFIETQYAYHWAFLFVHYIVDEYGWDTLINIQKDFEQYNAILGASDREINQGWRNYLEQNKVKPM